MTQTVIQLGSGRGGLPAGTRLSDIYELESTIAAGGMGEVYKGRMIETGDPVAIKMIKPELAGNDAVISLFRKEASSLHYLHHDAIVRYFVFSVDRTLGRPYLAMEFVDGPSLSDFLKKGPLNFEQLTVLRRRVASGLQAAHDKGVIHRDMSPDNIILQDGDIARAKIIDFGIARTTKFGHATVIGDGFAGKYNYVSPEQLGLFGGDVTNRSDIYSFGLVLAEAIIGRPIDMSGSQADVIQKRQKVPDLTGVDFRLKPLLERMLQPKPEDRPESMTEVASWIEQQPKAGGGRSGLIAASVAGLVALGAGVGGYLYLSRDHGPMPAPAPSPIIATPTLPQPNPVDVRPEIANTPPQMVEPPLEPLRIATLSPTERSSRVAQYVRYFDGGPCLYLTVNGVSERMASVDAFSLSDQIVQGFDTDFKLVNGFAPQISSLRLSNAHCPALAFMQRIDSDRDPALKFEFRQPSVRAGQRVQATIEGVGDRAAELLAVGDAGKVRLLQGLRRDKGTVLFDGRVDDEDNNIPGSKLVLLITSPKPIESLTPALRSTAWEFFPALLEEIQRTNQQVQIIPKLIRIER
ncbi:MAG: serine/threonine-protein kinase [Beijerinckiaceae bacterium]